MSTSYRIRVDTPDKAGFRKVVNSRWTFVALQGFDLVTTLVAFRMGALEANPLVAYLVAIFGGFRGVVISKLFAIAIHIFSFRSREKNVLDFSSYRSRCYASLAGEAGTEEVLHSVIPE